MNLRTTRTNTSNVLVKQSEENLVQVGPNPVISQVTVKLNKAINGKMTCQLINIQGKPLPINQITMEAGIAILDLSNVAPGTYVLKLQVEGQTIVRRIVKY